MCGSTARMVSALCADESAVCERLDAQGCLCKLLAPELPAHSHSCQGICLCLWHTYLAARPCRHPLPDNCQAHYTDTTHDQSGVRRSLPPSHLPQHHPVWVCSLVLVLLCLLQSLSGGAAVEATTLSTSGGAGIRGVLLVVCVRQRHSQAAAGTYIGMVS